MTGCRGHLDPGSKIGWQHRDRFARIAGDGDCIAPRRPARHRIRLGVDDIVAAGVDASAQIERVTRTQLLHREAERLPGRIHTAAVTVVAVGGDEERGRMGAAGSGNDENQGKRTHYS